ncbi:MAG: hypothetical protein KKI08_23555 [Armatimonadetes bacterium]|nr:hypothetical protein [Armatimonadota bacterium]
MVDLFRVTGGGMHDWLAHGDADRDMTAECDVSLTVCHGDVTDTIISTLDSPPYPERVTTNGVHLRGRLGIVREHGGKVEGAWLFEGEALSGGGWQIKPATSRHEGQIVAATRREDGAAADARRAGARPLQRHAGQSPRRARRRGPTGRAVACGAGTAFRLRVNREAPSHATHGGKRELHTSEHRLDGRCYARGQRALDHKEHVGTRGPLSLRRSRRDVRRCAFWCASGGDRLNQVCDVPDGRYCPNGLQWHQWTCLDNREWVHHWQDTPARDPVYTAEEVFEFVNICREKKAAMTFNVEILRNGRIADRAVELLADVSRRLGRKGATLDHRINPRRADNHGNPSEDLIRLLGTARASSAHPAFPWLSL